MLLMTSNADICVALHAESVDRNVLIASIVYYDRESLSMRRAWIEMDCFLFFCDYSITSLSMRRAWIEISVTNDSVSIWVVALHAESVDRNRGELMLMLILVVALHAESVDRNFVREGENIDRL